MVVMIWMNFVFKGINVLSAKYLYNLLNVLSSQLSSGAVYLDCKGDMEEIKKIVLYIDLLPQLHQPQDAGCIHSMDDDD